MKKLVSILMCSALLLCGWIVGTSQQSTTVAAESQLMPVLNMQSLPVDYQLSLRQQQTELTKPCNDTVYVKDTILITKKVRVPYRITKRDTVYCPIVFVFGRSELPDSSLTTVNDSVSKLLPERQE